MVVVAVIAFIALFALFVVVPTQVQKRHHRRDHEAAMATEQPEAAHETRHGTSNAPARATE